MTKTEVEEMEEVQLKVSGMACGGCKAAVEAALGSLEGVFSAEVDLGAKIVRVSYDSGKLARKDLQEAIEKAGYKVG